MTFKPSNSLTQRFNNYMYRLHVIGKCLANSSLPLSLCIDEFSYREMESAVSSKDFGFTTELNKEKDKLKEMQAKVDSKHTFLS